jgi:hypothetical protein
MRGSRKPFESLEQARRWVDAFVHWYNHEHCTARFDTSRRSTAMKGATLSSSPRATHSTDTRAAESRDDGQAIRAIGHLSVPSSSIRRKPAMMRALCTNCFLDNYLDAHRIRLQPSELEPLDAKEDDDDDVG